MIQVVALTRPFTHAGKDRYAAVLHGNVVDHFHHNNGLADPGSAEHPHLAPAGEGHQQINNLYSGFKNPHRRVLFREFGSFPMDRQPFVGYDLALSVGGGLAVFVQPIDRLAHDV